jgi:hypothetical protein
MRGEGQDNKTKYGFPAFINFQNHFIARVDDTAKVFLANIKAVGEFDFVVKAKLNWSKNVREERDCPFQFMMAASDHRYDTHLSLAVWEEVDLTENEQRGLLTPYVFTFSDQITVPAGSVKSKVQVSKYLREVVFKHELFANVQGNRGTRSIRKFLSTATRRAGINRDWKDMHGRWKRGKRVSDKYDNMELPYPDAKVAAVLRPGGPIKYTLREGSNISHEFILGHVAPKIAAQFGNDVAIVLGKALLWGAFAQLGTDNERIMPNWLAEQIHNMYIADIDNDLPMNTNPVKKVPFVVTGNEGEVYFDEIPNEAHGNPPAAGGAAPAPNGNHGARFVDCPIRKQLLGLHSQYFQLQQIVDSLREVVQNNHLQTTRGVSTIISSTNQLALAPGRRMLGGGGGNQGEGAAAGGVPIVAVATLLPTPRLLPIMWQEYNVGLGGRKAARLFTADERSQQKHKYSRRKVVWDAIDRMVLRGFTAQVAIDRIYQHYGRELSVTKVINNMLRDCRQNTVPAALR